MNLLIIGATGKTGMVLTRSALERGHHVTAFVRSPEKLGDLQHKVLVFQGDAMKQEDISKAMEGVDAVVSLVGHGRKTLLGMQKLTAQNLVSALGSGNTKRLIALSGAGVFMEGDLPGFFDRMLTLMVKRISGFRYTDGVDYCRIIGESEHDWTIVRAPILTNGDNLDYKSGKVGQEGMSQFLSRVAVSNFILDVLEQNDFIKASPLISNG